MSFSNTNYNLLNAIVQTENSIAAKERSLNNLLDSMAVGSTQYDNLILQTERELNQENKKLAALKMQLEANTRMDSKHSPPKITPTGVQGHPGLEGVVVNLPKPSNLQFIPFVDVKDRKQELQFVPFVDVPRVDRKQNFQFVPFVDVPKSVEAERIARYKQIESDFRGYPDVIAAQKMQVDEELVYRMGGRRFLTRRIIHPNLIRRGGCASRSRRCTCHLLRRK